MSTATAITRGLAHVGLTVPDLDETRDFFVNVLGFKLVGEKPDYPAAFVSDGHVLITLWQVVDPENAEPFDRKNTVGLHHLALEVDNMSVLEGVYELMRRQPKVSIEFAPEPLGTSSKQHMMCAIPGGIRMEFVAPAPIVPN